MMYVAFSFLIPTHPFPIDAQIVTQLQQFTSNGPESSSFTSFARRQKAILWRHILANIPISPTDPAKAAGAGAIDDDAATAATYLYTT
jgi:hypothetical protein